MPASSSDGDSERAASPPHPLSSFVPRLLLRLLHPPSSLASKPARMLRSGSLEVPSSPRPSAPPARRLHSLPTAGTGVWDAGQPEPALLSLPCALLFVDVSGFTSMMESAMQAASHGLEEVTGVISALFSSVMASVERFDGDLLKVAGDALLIAFYDLHASTQQQRPTLREAEHAEVLAEVCCRALDCAQDLLLRCDGIKAGARVLRLHVAVTCGSTHFIALGGCTPTTHSPPTSGRSSRRNSHNGLQPIPTDDASTLSVASDQQPMRSERWEFLAVGPSFSDLNACVHASAAGDVVVSADALRYATTQHAYFTTPIPNSEHRRLQPHTGEDWPSLRAHSTADREFAGPALPLLCGSQSLEWLDPSNFLMPALTTRVQQPSPRERGSPAATGHTGSAFASAGTPGWLAEYRRVTVAFVRLPTLDWSTVDPAPCARPAWLSSLQSLFVRVQRAVFATGGQVRQLLMDDKGCVCIVVYGLSPFSNEHHALRAVTFALALTQELSSPPEPPVVCIGVTTGRAYCGCVGSPERMEYTLYGAMVNCSARLMEAAWKAGTRVLCDDDTRKDCAARIRWTEQSITIALKGRPQPCTVHEPVEVALAEHPRPLTSLGSPSHTPPQPYSDRLIETQAAALGDPSPSSTNSATSFELSIVVDRERGRSALTANDEPELCAERGALYERIVQLLSDVGHRPTPIVVIEAGAGMGKSHLAQRVLTACESMNLTTLCGAGDLMETTTPFFAFLPILNSLFAHQHQLQAASGADESWLAPLLRPTERAFIPLLADVLPGLTPQLLQLSVHGQDAAADVQDADVRPQLILLMLTSLVMQVRRAVPNALLVIEDAHWMDADSWTLLRALIACPDVPVLLTARPLTHGGVVTTLPSFMEVSAIECATAVLTSPRTRLMRLKDLSASDGLALAAHELGCVSLSEALQGLIVQQADGIPLFIQQLCRYGKDQGLFVVDAKTGEADLSVELQGRRLTGGGCELLPDSLEGLLVSTLDRLEPSAQLLLKVASVMGRYFHRDLLLRVQEKEAPLLTLAELLSLLGHAQQNGVIQPVRENERISPSVSSHGEAMDPVYRFSHQLLRDAAYNTLLYQQRRELHARVAELLSAVTPSSKLQAASVQAMAMHYWWGTCDSNDEVVREVDHGFLVKATSHLLQAGLAAVRSGATSTSTCQMVRALRCIFAMDDRPEVQRCWELRWLLSWMGTQLMLKVIALVAFDREASHRADYAHSLVTTPSAFNPSRPVLLLQPFALRMLALLADAAVVAELGIDKTDLFRWRFVAQVALAYAVIGESMNTFYTACEAVCQLAATAGGADGELYRLEALMMRVQAASFMERKRQDDTLSELEGNALYRRLMTGEQRLSHLVLPHSILPRMGMELALQQWRFARFQNAMWTAERCAALQRQCWGPPPLMHPASLLFAACFQLRTLLSFGRHPATIAALAAVLARLPADNSADHRLAYIMRCTAQLVLKWWRRGGGVQLSEEDVQAVLQVVAGVHAEGAKLGPAAICVMGGGIAGIADYELDVQVPLSVHVALMDVQQLFPVIDVSFIGAENMRRRARMHVRQAQVAESDAAQLLRLAEAALAEAEALDTGAPTVELMRIIVHCELWLLQGRAAHALQRLNEVAARVLGGEDFPVVRHATAMRERLQQHVEGQAMLPALPVQST